MTPKQIAKWERIRARGRSWYILVFGVLGWGGTCAVGTYFWGNNYSQALEAGRNVFADFFLYSALWLLLGYFFGSFMWRVMEQLYESSCEGQGRASAPDDSSPFTTLNLR